MAQDKFNKRLRNVTLSLAQQNDPERFRTRTVESNKRKFKHSRRRQKEAFLNDIW
jgi:hypothetical protein